MVLVIEIIGVVTVTDWIMQLILWLDKPMGRR